MRYFITILSLIISLKSFAQKEDIESLINQIALSEVPDKFEFYYIVPKSLEHPKVYDSLQNHQKRGLLMSDPDFPLDLIYDWNKETVDWKKYDLKNVKYVLNEYVYQTTSPPTSKSVQFVKYNINEIQYDSLIEYKNPHTLIVKRKWIWSKKRVWNEVVKAWKKDEKKNLEEKIYFSFSKPIFSLDKKFARVSIFKKRRCKGNGFTALYKNNNGIWEKLIVYNQVASMVSMSHARCGDVSVSYQN